MGSAEIDLSCGLTLQAFSVPLLIKPSTSFFVLSLPSMCRNQFHILFTMFLFFRMDNSKNNLDLINYSYYFSKEEIKSFYHILHAC